MCAPEPTGTTIPNSYTCSAPAGRAERTNESTRPPHDLGYVVGSMLRDCLDHCNFTGKQLTSRSNFATDHTYTQNASDSSKHTSSINTWWWWHRPACLPSKSCIPVMVWEPGTHCGFVVHTTCSMLANNGSISSTGRHSGETVQAQHSRNHERMPHQSPGNAGMIHTEQQQVHSRKCFTRWTHRLHRTFGI